jgi:subtilisin-like proprotein convertase family protein
VYDFGHADVDVENTITVTGGIWNGVTQVDTFTQHVSADGLIVNDNDPGNQVLGTLALYITSDISGQIKIDVTNPLGGEVAIAGLAITTTKVGTISGTKWNDENGDRIFDPGEDKLEGWTIYLDLNNNGQLDSTTSASQTLTQASSDIPQAIPDQNIVGVKSTLDFTGVGIIEDVNVTLDITHTYDSDVHATLISPLGTRVRLFTNVGANGDNFQNTVLDDSGLIPIGTQQAPFTGTFRPEEPLSILNGEEASGQWKLELIDDAVGDTGVLNSLSL